MPYVHRDANHAAIVAALVGVGCAVLDLASLGGGAPDLYAEFQGRPYLIEVKTAAGRLSPRQRAWRLAWKGNPPIEVRTVEDVLALLGIRS